MIKNKKNKKRLAHVYPLQMISTQELNSKILTLASILKLNIATVLSMQDSFIILQL